MKIAQINSVCGFGSTGRIATDLHEIITKAGHEGHIYFGRNVVRNISSNYATKFSSKIGLFYHTLNTRLFDRHGLLSKNDTKKLVKELKRFNPDIIHLHNIHGYYINYEILFNYIKEENKKVIWTLHDCWAITGHCAYFDYNGEKTCWINGFHTCPSKMTYPQSFIFSNEKKNMEAKRKAFSNVKDLTIVTPSKWLANLIKKSHLKDYPISVINNGIDLKVFYPRENRIKEKYNITEKKIILGVASGWEERKGLKYFFELSQKIKDDEVIIIVGVNKKQREKFRKNMIGIERTNNIDELAELYSAADVFVNPTLEDNYPTTNLEAQACGTYVVTFNTGGSPETIFNQNGFVAMEKNIDSLYKEIRKVLDDRMKVNVKSVQKYINKNDLFEKYCAVYGL